MIPLRDKNPSNVVPYVTIGIIVVNIVMFFVEISLETNLDGFLRNYGVVPSKFIGDVSGDRATFIATFFPLFSYMFLHGGVVHLLGNIWYLWIFGDNIEDELGHFKYLCFYLFCGIVASLVHLVFNSASEVPCIGASGAIAGVLGAYTVAFPYARVVTIIPFLFIWPIFELPAMVVLGFWFVIQFFNGAVSITASTSSGSVAWWAHIGGFISGIGTFYFLRKLFGKKHRRMIAR
ncbi:MAG: rhomboid family intramembrane serine protease [Candidatus Scalindua sp. AMX11]|nr:MAG: rhomboid family intramembrane serine protease [Candidatus Scalindua sp.]NOG83343.1 rhomboid family intramembrane serine protease [Planctomycetota bacterium]RZV76755.1 MAG: rhomboid family intramembrane serine protease [Candidatus Scalindua sp. SCAELEC01]TDE63939.1 MAG: rhomboid family intramembrane serine protease [Candidatus Scalindua sp. AMX11]GJQ60261.1 MAG: rhomboid family intramembrane serine protease [Candidatus Scalindua sp.]